MAALILGTGGDRVAAGAERTVGEEGKCGVGFGLSGCFVPARMKINRWSAKRAPGPGPVGLLLCSKAREYNLALSFRVQSSRARISTEFSLTEFRREFCVLLCFNYDDEKT
jgi:hypothetical protein